MKTLSRIYAEEKMLKINSVLKVFLPIIFLLFSWSCDGKRHDNQSEVSVEFRWESFNQKYGNCDSLDQNCLRVFIEYPRFTSKKTICSDSLNHYIDQIILHPIFAGQPVKSPEDIFQQLELEFIKFQKKFPEYPTEWELLRKVDILYNRHQIVSLSFNEYIYTGGAHPGSTRLLRSFDLKTGERMTLTDLLFKENIDTFLQSAENKFRQQKGLLTDHDLAEAGYWFPGNRFQLNDNFALTENGIIFYYNPYEIAPYALGATELLLPFNEIQKFLRDKTLIPKG